MDALVLCGGFGTRFSSISQSPKVLAEIDGTVFLTYIINYIRSVGINKIYLSVGYKSEEIINFVSENYTDDQNIIILKEPRPLGTGGAVKFFFQSVGCQNIFVMNGDTYWDKKVSLDSISVKAENLILWCKTISENDRFGHIEIRHNGVRFLKGTKERPIENSLIYVGLSVIPASLFSGQLVEPFSLEDAISQYKGEVDLLTYEGNYYDFGVPEAYYKLKEKLSA